MLCLPGQDLRDSPWVLSCHSADHPLTSPFPSFPPPFLFLLPTLCCGDTDPSRGFQPLLSFFNYCPPRVCFSESGYYHCYHGFLCSRLLSWQFSSPFPFNLCLSPYPSHTLYYDKTYLLVYPCEIPTSIIPTMPMPFFSLFFPTDVLCLFLFVHKNRFF